MQAVERQRRIESFLRQVEFASLEALSELVDASASTVRRDLTVLEFRGGVKRTHGGARLADPPSDEFAFAARDTRELAEKEAIAQACSNLVKSNESVILDAGTTVYHVARHLESKTPYIITNSLPVAHAYSSAGHLEVVVSGGVIYPRLGVLVGPLAVEAFSKISADLAIMGAGGITPEGITNSHGLLIDIQRVMIRSAGRVIFCIDHTKFGRRSFSNLCKLSPDLTVVTDRDAPLDMVREIRKRGVEVVMAEKAEGSHR